MKIKFGITVVGVIFIASSKLLGAGLALANKDVPWPNVCGALSKEIQVAESRARGSASPDGFFSKTWDSDSFTNPKFHNPKSFKYVIHAVLQTRKFDSVNLGRGGGPIFASFITERTQKNRIWENSSGLVLSIKPDNVVGTSCVDTGFNFPKQDVYTMAGFESGYRQYKEFYGMQTPKDLFLANLWPSYIDNVEFQKKYFFVLPKNNEILLRGIGVKGSIVRISAIFISPNDRNTELTNALKHFAEVEKLPILNFE